MKRNKKGFTIVELVIVIAVIAILAAVLIPTFSSLINKAKESSDTALVKNLNIIMAADEAENGKSETMSEALAAAESAGYTIEKITPTSSGDILWDEQNNRFVLKKADGTYYAENGNVTEDHGRFGRSSRKQQSLQLLPEGNGDHGSSNCESGSGRRGKQRRRELRERRSSADGDDPHERRETDGKCAE